METTPKTGQLWGNAAVQQGITDPWLLSEGHTSIGGTTLLTGEEITIYETPAEGGSDGREWKLSPGTANSPLHPSPRKRAFSLLALCLLTGLTAAGILTGTLVGLRHPHKIDAEKLWPPIPLVLEPRDLIHYENALITASTELEETWRRSPETVRAAFTKHFVPEVKDEGSGQTAISLIQQHVQIVRDIQRPSETANEEKKREYAFQLLLMRAVTTAATSRLKSLAELDEFCKERKIGSELLGLPMPKPPPPEDLAQQTEDLISFPEFLIMVNREVDRSSLRRPGNQKIPRDLAQNIANLVLAGDMRAEADRKAHNVFHDLLDSLSKSFPSVDQTGDYAGFDMLPMPGDDMPFPLSIFSVYLSEFDRNSKNGSISSEILGFFSSKWTAPGAIQQLEMVHEIERSWLSQLQRTKEHHRENWRKISRAVNESRLPSNEEDGQMGAEGVLSLALALL